MPLKLNLTVPNKAVHVFIGLVVVVALVVGVYAYTFPGGFIGHGGDHVWIDLPAGEMDLQAAIDGGMFGDITDVLSGVGTKGGASSGAATIEFDCSEVSGNGITCSGEDLQVNTGATSTTGLEIVSDQVRLMNDGCAAGEVLKRNAANNGWECVAGGGGQMAVTTGTIAHGGTIPLPGGYVQAECKWFVSINTLSQSFPLGAMEQIRCFANAARVVTCTVRNWAGTGFGTANYMVICNK